MTNTLEKRLYKNLILIILLVIFSIAISIALLSGITSQLSKLKNGKFDTVIKMFQISETHKLKQTLLKNVFLSYGNSKQFNSYLKLYYDEKNIENIIMRKTEKKISKLSSQDSREIADLYLSLYNIISKENIVESELITDLKENRFSSALKTYKLNYKNSDAKLNEVLNKLNEIIGNQTNSVKSVSKGKFLLSIIINTLSLLFFLIITIRVISSVSKNIKYLHNSVIRLKDKNFDTPISLKTNDELEELATALDRMRQSYLKSIKFLHKKVDK